MDQRGRIIEVDETEHERLMQQRLMENQGRMRHSVTPLTDREAAFFKSKGQALRTLWGSRLARGLTVDQKRLLNQLVNEFHRDIKVESNS